MKKIIDFILKELNILFTDYQTKTLHDSFFVFLFHMFLWIGGYCLLIFGVVFFVVSIIISETWAFLLTFGALGVSLLFKRIRVLLFFQKDD